ncbi:MAG TPA: cytochrome c oxidase subunit II [Candidatus Baltobacteraceae bacterium]|nr:cytochrome c oxidase subunit II [Candidatus Baltobacteraceae bacterium]
MHLDRGFWTATAVIVLLSIAAILFWVFVPITGIMPEAVDRAAQIDSLYRFLAASGTALLVAVFGYILYFVFRFRRRANQSADEIGLQIHDNHKLEFWWTLLPALYILILAIISVNLFFQIEPVNAQGNTLVVEALGHQWYYTFRYPGIHGEVKEMHLPLHQPVTLHVTSYDVIHSFWIPDMRLKADMVPGSINTLVFTPTRVGKYELLCTEFCGTLHGAMRSGTPNDPAYVYIDPPDKYKAWYDATQKAQAGASDAIAVASAGAVNLTGGDPAKGHELFETKCSACHALGPFDKKIVGPGLMGVLHDPAHPNLVNGEKATPDNVAKILQNGFNGPMGTMPNQTANGLSDKDIANLVAYLNSLK